MGPRDTAILTVTGSSGMLKGTLTGKATSMRLPGRKYFQDVYQVVLEGSLAQGDCGAPVVDRLRGWFYGHIAIGVVGTGIAYIIPANKVMSDIAKRLRVARVTKPINIGTKDRKPRFPGREGLMYRIGFRHTRDYIANVDIGSSRFLGQLPPLGSRPPSRQQAESSSTNSDRS